MSAKLHVYVGPYLMVDRPRFNLDDWCDLVYDGRGDEGRHESTIYLLPNRHLEGVTRCMVFTDLNQNDVTNITTSDIACEVRAFHLMAKDVLEWCASQPIPVRDGWGVVCGWF